MTKRMLTRFSMFLKAAVLTVFALAAVACADYDDKNEIKDSYYAWESALIEAETLKSYIDAGHITPDGRKVVILDVTNSTTSVIKGALNMPQDTYFRMGRSDGPVSLGSGMVVTGERMDAAIRFAGIDGNTLIVVTAATPTENNVFRTFWTFKYWGFSNKSVKVLNGANKYFSATFPNLMEAPGNNSVVPSTFSVKDLPGNNVDLLRASLGEILEDVKVNAYGTGAKMMIPTMNPSNAVMSGGVEVTKVANAGAVTGRIKGSIQLMNPSANGVAAASTANYQNADGRFKTADEIAPLMVNLDGQQFLPADKSTRIITHCGSGQSTSPHWFVISEILGYRNSAIYDGSWSEWGVLTTVKPASVNETFAQDNPNKNSYLTWDAAQNAYIDSVAGLLDRTHFANTPFLSSKYDTSRYTDFLTLNSGGPSGTYDNSYTGDAKEINEEDKNYQQNIGGSSAGSNAAAGGGAPAGC